MTSKERVYRCFFCDEEFSGVDATNHFGRREDAEPACKIKAAGEFALLQALRNAEDDLSRHRAEDSDTQRAMHAMIADHQVALRREEEKGYARGLRDAQHVETAAEPAPIPMVLQCPMCQTFHIDAPNPEKGWTNPPHRSHECQLCGCIWRPADVPTTGVLRVLTRGKADTWPRRLDVKTKPEPAGGEM